MSHTTLCVKTISQSNLNPMTLCYSNFRQILLVEMRYQNIEIIITLYCTIFIVVILCFSSSFQFLSEKIYRFLVYPNTYYCFRMSSCLKLVIRPKVIPYYHLKPPVFNVPSPQKLFHTSNVVQLRKAPVGRGPLVRMKKDKTS